MIFNLYLFIFISGRSDNKYNFLLKQIYFCFYVYGIYESFEKKLYWHLTSCLLMINNKKTLFACKDKSIFFNSVHKHELVQSLFPTYRTKRTFIEAFIATCKMSTINEKYANFICIIYKTCIKIKTKWTSIFSRLRLSYKIKLYNSEFLA